MLQYEIIVDHGETANKCTIMPLKYREDFRIIPVSSTPTFVADLLLHPEGKPLSNLNLVQIKVERLGAIDCVWRRLAPILATIEPIEPLLVSIPPGFLTAYPRVSRKDFDPQGGLATIEAIFIAAAFLGTWDLSLLREYFFAEEFLEINRDRFISYGIKPVLQKPVYQPINARNSQTRRIGRGRIPVS